MVMVFNATFNNISDISWLSVLLVENWSTRRKPPTCRKSLTNFITMLVVIGTDYTGSCKSNYHTITTTTAIRLAFRIWTILCSSITLSENIKFINLHLLRNMPEKLTKGLLFSLFLKLVQIKFIFSNNVQDVRILSIYYSYN
jgi:hypothetical protein